MKTTIKISLLVLALGTVMSCKKDEEKVEKPNNTNPGELITSVVLKLKKEGVPTDSIMASFKDLDGPGGNSPVVSVLSIKPNTTYLTEVLFLDESKNPVENITEEILEEANDHQVFYQYNSNNASIAYNDLDNNTPALPLGLKTKWTTLGVGNGSVKITLKHQPGSKNNAITTGETDVEVDFSVRVEN